MRAAAWLAAVAATLALLELGTRLLVDLGALATPPATNGDTGFWRGHHPRFGVWHAPDATTEHRRACFRVRYHTNSVGARDVERPLRSQQPRVVVLGDSFLEGWGVASEQRLSDRLERATGVPHLNFAMSHFSPYQQVIVYRELASRFDHTAVIAGIAPLNDLLDLDLERARVQPRYEYRYRPYLVGEPPDFEHFDYREPEWRRLGRRYSYAFNALLAAARSRREADAAGEEVGPDGRPPSRFYDFGERGAALLEASLQRLAQATAGKPTAVLLIPALRDLERYAEAGPDPLSARLRPVADRLGLELVNLLPAMADYTRGWRGYYHPCDFHWSGFGNSVASELVRRALGPDFYPPEAGLETGPEASAPIPVTFRRPRTPGSSGRS